MSDKYMKNHVFLISDKTTVMNLLLKTSILHFQSNTTITAEMFLSATRHTLLDSVLASHLFWIPRILQ